MPVVSGQITTNAPSNTYATHDSRLGLGGVHDVADITARDAITTDRKRVGMLAFVASESRFYKLDALPNTWTQWVDATSFVFDTRDALATYALTATTPAPLVYVRSYHGSTGPNANPAGYTARYPGIGSRFWQYHAGNTLATDGRAIIPVGSAGALGRYLPVFDDGRVDVTAFGARPARATNGATSITFTDVFTTETNAAVQAAAAYAQNQNTPEFVLFGPEGIYQITQSLQPATDAKKFHLEGIARTVGYPPGAGYPSEWAWFNGGTTFCMMTSGVPIIKLLGNDGSIKNVNLTYATEQLNTATTSVAILGAGGHQKWDIRNVGVFFTGYLVHVPPNSGNSVNCTWDGIYCMRARAGAIRIEESGTVNNWNNIYLQNKSDDRRQFSAMSKTGTEFQITISNATGLPSGVQKGTMVQFFFAKDTEDGQPNVSSYQGGQFFVKSITPDPAVSTGSWVLKFDHTDPGTNHSGSAPTVGSIIHISSTPFAVTSGVSNTQVYLGPGYESDWQALDIEGSNPTTTADTALFFENWGKTNIGKLHFEYSQPRANSQSFIVNRGTLSVDMLSVVNVGLNSAYTLYGITNRDASSVNAASARIGTFTIRDLADVGGVFNVARSITTSTKVVVGSYSKIESYRANAKSSWPVGDAVSNPAVLLDTENASVAGTGLLEVIGGAQQTPKTFVQHASDNLLALQGVLGVGGNSGGETGFALTGLGQWAPEDAYTTIKEGTSFIVCKALRDITDLQITFPGLVRPSTFVTPTEDSFQQLTVTGVAISGSGPYTVTLTHTEARSASCVVGKRIYVAGVDADLCGSQVVTALPSSTTIQYSLVADPGVTADVTGTVSFNKADPFEVKVSINEVSSSDYTTELGVRTFARWGNRYLYKVEPGTQIPCDPIRRFIPAGAYIKMWVYCNILKSDTTTFVTEGVVETGQLTEDSEIYPRTANYGVNTKTGALGIVFNSSSTIDPATYDRTVSGGVTPTNTMAVMPSMVTARFVDNGAGAAAFPAVGVCGDSIAQGVGDIGRLDAAEGSGRGYVHRAFAHIRPVYNASTGGNGAQYWVGTPYRYNWVKRAAGLRQCNVFFVPLGINDIAATRTEAQIKADLQEFWGYLRKLRTSAKIIGGSITPRWASSNAYLTTGGMTLPVGIIADHNTKVVSLNAWLAAQVGVSGGLDDFVDFTSSVCESGGIFYKVSEVVYTLTAAAGSTNTSINLDAGTLIPGGESMRDYCVYVPAATSTQKHQAIVTNTASNLTVTAGLTGTITAGDTIQIVKAWTVDNVHPTGWIHGLMANKIVADIAKFTR